MSVANILDPATGLVNTTYLQPGGSSFPPNEIVPFGGAVAVGPVGVGGGNIVVPGTLTTVSLAPTVYIVSGFYSLKSSAASVAGSGMALYATLSGTGPIINLPLVQVPEAIASGPNDYPQQGSFSGEVRVPIGYSFLSISFGAGDVPNVGTIEGYVNSVFINQITP